MASATQYVSNGGQNGDRPTNLSLSDVDTVTTALMTSDAFTILSSEIGEDRFGKLCAEVKFSLIDLEAEVAIS